MFIQLSSYACIIVYSGIFCFTTSIVNDLHGISQITLYLIMVLGFFVIKYVVDTLYSEPDEMTKDFIKRQSLILGRLATKSTSKTSK